MSKVNLNDVTSGFASSAAVNANNTAIEVAFENTLSRDGAGPNQMLANLDMNGYSILNQGNTLTVSGFNWTGPWVAATSYDIGDVVESDNSSYIAITAHSSSSLFTTDFGSGYWQVIASSASLPSQLGNNGKILSTDGGTASWIGIDTVALPIAGGEVTGALEVGRLYTETAITAAPASLGNHDSIATAFSGDLTSLGNATSHKITGTTTIGQPSSGYLYTPEAYPHYTFLHNESGWNQSTSTNAGRTSAVAHRVKIYQAGQGDSVCFNGSVYVASTKSGSTDFLANPAGSLFNGDMQAGANGVYLNPYETHLSDNGYDAACIGAVHNFDRTNNTAAKSTFWGGSRYQSVGTVACDSVISATGKFKVGIDFAMSSTDFGTTKAAISLKAGQRVCFNNLASASGSLKADWRTTTFNEDYIDYDTATSRLRVMVGNAAVVTFHTSDFVNFNNSIALAADKSITINGKQVVQGRNVGFTPMTGVLDSSSIFSTSTVTLEQLAQRVNSIQTALTIHGLIGA